MDDNGIEDTGWWTYPLWIIAGAGLLILVGIALIIKGLIWGLKVVKNTILIRDSRTANKAGISDFQQR